MMQISPPSRLFLQAATRKLSLFACKWIGFGFFGAKSHASAGFVGKRAVQCS
jgi:hypothetical protein